jgi:hypothetical protein
MKNCLLIVSFLSFIVGLNFNLTAQQANNKVSSVDSTKKSIPAPVKKDTLPETGIAVSPSTLRFNAKPGTLQTKIIKISNETRKTYTFQVMFQDYAADEDGEGDAAASKYSMYSLSKYMVINPTVVELGPRQSKKISVTVDIPPGDSMAVSMWTILDIDQVIEREQLDVPNQSQNSMGMGVKNSMGFGIYVYQDPPNVTVSNVEIIGLRHVKSENSKSSQIIMDAKNAGTGIGYCLYYLELTNLITGKQTKMKVKQFSIFPGYKKHFSTSIGEDFEKGPYSVMAVLDFGNKEELQTAEMEFTVE